ncbi:uncharacterized protein LOC126978134 [Leptidea sinapis]|uniref:uncharacterized protein LOC126978134 n=1 Tax=Leptidea sinapis TaxID=189913 RepID=UPI0021C36698|nr:uncharacterized protein LOC126978134 [Leptidea sinapis]
MTEENKATKERVSSEIGDRSNQSFLGDPLSAKHAVEMLLNDTLQYNVCRYCLHVTTYLRELDEILTMGGKDAFFEVTINDIIASVHPFKVNSKTNVLNKICNMCLDKAISCYLFAQQCEQSERALRNYFEEIIDKFNKLDPIEPVKKRGKRKINPNYNILFVEHENVIDFAEPIINIVNLNAVPNEQDTINDLECSKCWQVLPNTISLLNHEKSHPKSMWYHCRLCGKSFVRIHQYKRHIRNCHISNEINVPEKKFKCNECGIMNEQFSIHLQHVEKHKFKSVFECLIKQNLKCICMICFGKEETLIDLNESMHFHGGYKELSGERSISSILTRVLPNNNVNRYQDLLIPLLPVLKRKINDTDKYVVKKMKLTKNLEIFSQQIIICTFHFDISCVYELSRPDYSVRSSSNCEIYEVLNTVRSFKSFFYSNPINAITSNLTIKNINGFFRMVEWIVSYTEQK